MSPLFLMGVNREKTRSPANEGWAFAHTDGQYYYSGVDSAWFPWGTAIRAVGFAPVG